MIYFRDPHELTSISSLKLPIAYLSHIFLFFFFSMHDLEFLSNRSRPTFPSILTPLSFHLPKLIDYHSLQLSFSQPFTHTFNILHRSLRHLIFHLGQHYQHCSFLWPSIYLSLYQTCNPTRGGWGKAPHTHTHIIHTPTRVWPYLL